MSAESRIGKTFSRTRCESEVPRRTELLIFISKFAKHKTESWKDHSKFTYVADCFCSAIFNVITRYRFDVSY